MFLNDVWNAIGTIAESFVKMMRHPSGPMMPAGLEGPLPSTSSTEPYTVASEDPSTSVSAVTPYTAGKAPLQVSPDDTMFVTPIVPLPTVKASELRAATRCLVFPATPIPAGNPQLLIPIRLHARLPLPGCSPYALPWSSSIIKHEQGTPVYSDVQIKSEPLESEELLFDGASNMDTLPFDTLIDAANIKIESQCKMEPLDLNSTIEPIESSLIEYKKEYYNLTFTDVMFSPTLDMKPIAFQKTLQNMESTQKEFEIEPNEVTEANINATVELAEVTDENAPCMQDIAVASAQDEGMNLIRSEAQPALQEAILSAVRMLRDRNGSSAQAIKRYISQQASVTLPPDNSLFNISLRKLVEYGSLIQTKGTGARGSFKLAVETNNNEAKTRKSKLKSTRLSPKTSEKTRATKKSITTVAKKNTPTKFVRSTRRTSKLHNELLRSNIAGGDISSISLKEKRSSSRKNEGVKALTKGTHTSNKGNKKSKAKLIEPIKDTNIPYSMWHQMHSSKWNRKGTENETKK